MHSLCCPDAMFGCACGPVRICPGTLAFIPGTLRDPKTLFVGCVARRLVRQRAAVFIQTKRVAQVAFCLHIRPDHDDGVDSQDRNQDRNRKKRATKNARGARRRRHSSSSCRCCLAFLLFGFPWVAREGAHARSAAFGRD